LLLVDDPDFPREVGDYLLEINTGIVERLVACGVDWIHIGDDLSFKSGLIATPGFFFDYYPPRIKRQIEPAKKAGIPVTFHSDGKVDMVVDMLVECGLDAINPIEPYSNDPYEIARLADGRIGLIGNLEFAMMSPSQASGKAREMIARMGPRYVPASSHSLTNDVPVETYACFLKELQNYR
jgi:uroporphyrinogen decarboxylase